MNRKTKLITVFLILIMLLNIGFFFIKYNYVKATDNDVYDIILFWGQSNMVSHATQGSSMPGNFSTDKYNFSKETDIDIDILNNTKSTNIVNTPMKSKTAYIYKYLSNSFDEITSNTYILGDGLEESEINNGKLHGLSYNPTTKKLDKYYYNSDSDRSYLSIETRANVNMIPEFCRTYYERTGHKVIAVNGAVGGAPIEYFLPKDDPNHKTDGYTDYMYEAIKENFSGAVKLAQKNNLNIGGKYWICFQGEANIDDTDKSTYEKYFTQVKNNMKSDLGTTSGAIVETTHILGYGWSGISQVHKSQENLIKNNSDIILGSSYDYDHYIPDENTYNSSSFSTKKYLDSAGNKLDYSTALAQANKTVCAQYNNAIHFHSAALSQIGRDCANSLANSLGYSNNFNNLKEIKYSSISNDNAYYNNLQIPSISAGDPFIIENNGTYYLYVTDNIWYTSKDLKNWSNRGNYINPSSLPSNVNIQYYWAPEVYKYNGKFYMIFSGVYWGDGYPYGTTCNGAIYLAETDNLEKGFTFVKKIDVGLENIASTVNNNFNYIDGTFLFEGDSIYMYFKSEAYQNIYGIELDSNFNKKTNTPTKLLDLDASIWERNINEGPFVIKKNNTYYLMYSTGEYTNDCYSVGYATSSSPLGTFTKKTINGPFLYGSSPKYSDNKYTFDSSKYIYGSGHNMILKMSDDEMYIVYHSATFNKNNYITNSGDKYNGQTISQYTGRKLNLDRLVIDSSGNLVVNGPSTVNQPLPSGTTYNGVKYSQLASSNYSLNINNNSEVKYLSDNISYLTKNTTAKFTTTKKLDINLKKRMDVTDIWLYSSGSSLGFNNAVVDISINDKYVIKNVSLGTDSCVKLNIPYNMENLKNEHIKSIKIIADKDISISEVKAITTNSDKMYDDTYTVKFDMNNGSGSVKSMTYNVGSTLGSLPAPVKTGYTFKGWFTSPTGGTKILTSTIVDANTTYYAQWEASTNTKYIVNHWTQNINGSADQHNSQNYTQKDQEVLYGTTDSKVTPAVKNYDGFTSPNSQTLTISANGTATLNYYYTRNKYTLNLKHDNGVTSVSGAGSYYYEQPVTINAKIDNNFSWVNWTGTDTLTNIKNTFNMPSQDVELTANTLKKDARILVKYVDINSKKELIQSETLLDNSGKNFSLKPKELENYQYITSDGITEGTLKAGDSEVTFYYAQKTAIKVQYIDIYTKEKIIDDIIIEGYEGKEYSTEQQDLENYIFLNSTDNTSGIMSKDGDTVIYTYGKKTNLEVQYLDQTTNETISETKIIDGYVGKEYDIKPLQIDGYKYMISSDNTTGIMTEEPIQIYFQYLKTFGVNVKYVDINTNEEIKESKNYDYTINSKYDVSNDFCEIDSYTFIKNSGNTSGTLTEENIDVIYYYAASSNIIITFYDIDTNEKINKSELVAGYEGKEYKIIPREIDGYKFIKSNNSYGIMTRKNINVDCYYKKIDNNSNNNNNSDNNNNSNNNNTNNSNNSNDNNNNNNTIDNSNNNDKNNSTTSNNNSKNNLKNHITDNTTSNSTIPKTGKSIIAISTIISIIVSITFFIKYIF